MAPRTPTPLIKVEVAKKAEEQTPVPHNRWHPDIPAVSEDIDLLRGGKKSMLIFMPPCSAAFASRPHRLCFSYCDCDCRSER